MKFGPLAEKSGHPCFIGLFLNDHHERQIGEGGQID